MSDRFFLILGAGLMQAPAIRLAKKRGLTVVVADADSSAVSIPLADRFERIDLKDKEGMESLARRLSSEGTLAGVMTAGTDFSATVAWVAERLGLPGIPYEVALDASDKARMRARFAAAGVPSPHFSVVSSIADLSSVDLPFPLVVKPVDNMGGRGCCRVDARAALGAAVEDALRYSRSSRAIVEEFMDGPEFSVDALVYNGEITICGLADRHIYFPPYFIEMGHTMPTALPPAAQEELLGVFRTAVAALGITNGAAKGDVKFTSRGPAIGEIAARLSGGYMSGWTYPYASGIEVTDGAIAIALGEQPVFASAPHSSVSAERAFISIPGTVRCVRGLEEARAIPGVRDIFLRAGEGTTVDFPKNNVGKAGNVITRADDRVGAVDAALHALDVILLPLQYPDSRTASFLSVHPSSVPHFPPDAYALPDSLISLLDLLPDTEEGPLSSSGPLPYLPFIALETSSVRDWAGRSVAEGLCALERASGRSLSLSPSRGEHGARLGRSFWRAFVRGGYQGALYYIEGLSGKA